MYLINKNIHGVSASFILLDSSVNCPSHSFLHFCQCFGYLWKIKRRQRISPLSFCWTKARYRKVLLSMIPLSKLEKRPKPNPLPRRSFKSSGFKDWGMLLLSCYHQVAVVVAVHCTPVVSALSPSGVKRSGESVSVYVLVMATNLHTTFDQVSSKTHRISSRFKSSISMFRFWLNYTKDQLGWILAMCIHLW